MGKMICLFCPHHRDCERQLLVSANEPARFKNLDVQMLKMHLKMSKIC